jgi:hypothetical protein
MALARLALVRQRQPRPPHRDRRGFHLRAVCRRALASRPFHAVDSSLRCTAPRRCPSLCFASATVAACALSGSLRAVTAAVERAEGERRNPRSAVRRQKGKAFLTFGALCSAPWENGAHRWIAAAVLLWPAASLATQTAATGSTDLRRIGPQPAVRTQAWHCGLAQETGPSFRDSIRWQCCSTPRRSSAAASTPLVD